MILGEIAPMPIIGAIEPLHRPISRDSIVKCNTEKPVQKRKIAPPQQQLKREVVPSHKTSEFE